MKTIAIAILLLLTTLPALAQETVTCEPTITDPLEFYNLGWDNYRVQDYQAALNEFGCALTLDPDYLDALHMQGLIYEQLEMYEEALVSFGKVVARDPNYSISYIGLGNVSLEVGEYDAAVEYFTRYLEIDPNDATMFYNRALAYYRGGQYEDAIADYDRAVELNPNLSDAYAGRALALNALERSFEALISVEDAINREITSHAWYLSTLGESYLQLGQYEEAKIALDAYMLLVDAPSDAALANIARLDALLSGEAVAEEMDTAATGQNGAAASPIPSISTDCTVTAIDSANRRNGAGMEFIVIGTLEQGIPVPINAQKRDSEGMIWWRIADGSGWLRQDTVYENGDCESVEDLSS